MTDQYRRNLLWSLGLVSGAALVGVYARSLAQPENVVGGKPPSGVREGRLEPPEPAGDETADGAADPPEGEGENENPDEAADPGGLRLGFPKIIDTATRITPAMAQTLKALGVETVFRYYSLLPPSIRDKHLEPPERDVLFDAGLNIGAVYQHHNNCVLTFQNNWGREDAEQSLRQAEAVGQPEGSAIYFGVDNDWPYRAQLSQVVRYFEAVNAVFEGSGYGVGVYGGGCTLHTLKQRGLASYFWLGGATGFSGTQGFYNRGDWTMFQNILDVTFGTGAGRLPVDTNLANPGAADAYVGQFGPNGPARSAAEPAEARRVLAARRFIARDAVMRASASTGARAVMSLRKDRNVRLLETSGDWAKVVAHEGGSPRGGGPSGVEGYLRLSELKEMTSFPNQSEVISFCDINRTGPTSSISQRCRAARSRS